MKLNELTFCDELDDQQAESLAGGAQPSDTGSGLTTGSQASGGSNSKAFDWKNPNNPPPPAWFDAGFGTVNAPGQQ